MDVESQFQDEVQYRLLNADEWGRLKEIYPEDKPLPNPLTASVAVAEKGGKLVACWFLQLAFHFEPLIIKDPGVKYVELAAQILKRLPPDVQIFTRTKKNLDGVAASLGLRKSDENLYIGGASWDS